MNKEKPLIMKLPRQTGMKESRYMHLLSGEPDIEALGNQKDETASNDENRIMNIETELESLKNEVNELKAKFEKFKHQFE
jgi:uncharacterized protein YceH (UPF0502 family)